MMDYIREGVEIKNFLTLVKGRSEYTPDFFNLKEEHGNHVPVFLYGRDQSKHENGHILKGCSFYGNAKTQPNEYYLLLRAHGRVEMVETTSRSMQLNFNFGRKAEEKGILGELWGVPLHVLCKLDIINGNAIRTVRKSKTILVEPRSNVYKPIEAQVYMGEYETWAQLNSTNRGAVSLCPTCIHNKRPVYYF